MILLTAVLTCVSACGLLFSMYMFRHSWHQLMSLLEVISFIWQISIGGFHSLSLSHPF
jgi:hypothetical protein